MRRPRIPAIRAVALTAAVTLFAGCTTFSKDGGFGAVSTTASARLGKDAMLARTDEDRLAIAKRTQDLLAAPLSMDDAVQIALLNNRGLQASYGELGIAEADLVQTDLLAADAMLKVAADARRAYVGAVAAKQSAAYAEQVKDSAEAGAELAWRMQQAGHFSKLDYAREQAFYAQALADMARARQQSVSAREKLTRVMGLWGSQAQYDLPERLPDLPAARPELHDLESFAMQNRLDIQAAKLQTQSVASSLGLSKATHFVNVLDVGYPNAEMAINARSEVRESYSAYVSEYDLAKHYRDEVVPLRKTISDELLLRYNGMLASVFELLADSRDQIGAVNSAIGALRDFWLAQTDLQQVLGGRLPSSAMTAITAAPRASRTQPASSTESEDQ